MEINCSCHSSAASAVILAGLLFLAGCIASPPVLDTPDDFRREFALSGKTLKTIDGNILSLENAIACALANNPTNIAAAQAVRAARYGYYQALSAYLPEVNAGYSLEHTLSRGWDLLNPPEGMLRKNDHFVTSGSLRASFLLFDGFARELETIIARQEYNKSAAASRNIRRLLKRATAYAYYDMYLAEEEMKIFRQDFIFQSDALIQEQQRFRSGHVSKASVLNFQILAARAESNISNAKYRKRVALHALTALMGYERKDFPDDIRLEEISTENLPHIHEDEFYLELAVSNRPDLKAEKIVLDIAYRNFQKAYAEFLPVIHLFSELSLYTYRANYGNNVKPSAHGNQRGFSYGAVGEWNIFKGFYSINNLKRQQVLEKIALWGLNARFLEISAEVRDACANCRNSGYQVQIFRSMANWVREQRDLVYSEYRNGRETITRLNEAQSTLVEAQNRLIVSAIQFNKAVVQLAASTGTDISGSVFKQHGTKAVQGEFQP